MPNTREKLIELVDNVLRYLPWGEISSHTAEDIADHLIANGVTINPCKVGDTVYALYSRHEYKKRSGAMYRQNCQILTLGHLKFAVEHNAVEVRAKDCTKTDMSLLGKVVFTTREEAERVCGNEVV